MRFSINTVLFTSPFTNADTKLFARLATWGFDAVELLIEDPEHITPRQIKKALHRNGLVCGSIAAAINPARDLRGNRSAQRNGVAYLCGLIDQLVQLDARILAGPIYSYSGRAKLYSATAKKRQWQSVVKNLKQVAHYAAARNKLICIEPINRFESDFLNTMDQGRQLINAVGNPALKLHLDTFHANIEEKNLATAIRSAGQILGHIHACGCDRGTPGKDHTDWRGMARALKEIGYGGDIVLETVTLDVPCIARHAAIWRRIEPTQAEIAEEGLKFLKQMFR